MCFYENNLFGDMDDINDTKTCSYFRYYQNLLNTSPQGHLFDALVPLKAASHIDDTKPLLTEKDGETSAFDMQLKFARLIVYGAQEFVISNQLVEVESRPPSSFLSDTTFAFLQIVCFITVICLIRQYLNLRVVKEEPLRLINKTGEYDAYDLVPDTPLNRKASQKQTSNNVQHKKTNNIVREKQHQQLLQINSKTNRQNNHHLINNDLFTERETILLLNKLNAAASSNNSNAPCKKKYNTDKFVTNKRKCTSVGPVMNASCKEMLATTLPVKDEKFASMLENSVQHIQQHDENSLTCDCEANWRQAVMMHHQNEAAIYNHMCV